MKFLITWQMHEGKLHDTLALFSRMGAEQDAALMGEGVKMIGRWHDLVRGGGAAIFEAQDSESLTAYALNWNKYMDVDIAVVVDDDEARAIGGQLEGTF